MLSSPRLPSPSFASSSFPFLFFLSSVYFSSPQFSICLWRLIRVDHSLVDCRRGGVRFVEWVAFEFAESAGGGDGLVRLSRALDFPRHRWFLIHRWLACAVVSTFFFLCPRAFLIRLIWLLCFVVCRLSRLSLIDLVRCLFYRTLPSFLRFVCIFRWWSFVASRHRFLLVVAFTSRRSIFRTRIPSHYVCMYCLSICLSVVCWYVCMTLHSLCMHVCIHVCMCLCALWDRNQRYSEVGDWFECEVRATLPKR